MTLLELRTVVLQNLGREGETSLEDRVDSYLNLGLRELTKAHLFRELITSFSGTLAANDYTEAMPARTRHVLEVRVYETGQEDSAYQLRLYTRDVFLSTHPAVSEESSGVPLDAWVDGTTLTFAPPANTTYVITGYVYRYPATLTADADANPVTDLDMALISFATASMFASMEQFESSKHWQQQCYGIDLPNAIRADERRPGEIRFFASHKATALPHPKPWLHPFSGHRTSHW